MKQTRSYDLFKRVYGNREVNLKGPRAAALRKSMEDYGWLDAFPLMARRVNGSLDILDGQHRLAIAEQLRLPVKYVVEKQDVDIADVNSSSRVWGINDYVNRYAYDGIVDYKMLQQFSNTAGLGISVCMRLLGSSNTNALRDGRWEVTKDVNHAEEIVNTMQALSSVNKIFRKSGAITTLALCYELDYFDPARLVRNAKKHGEFMYDATSITAFIGLFDEIYNSRSRARHPLKFDLEELRRKHATLKDD